MKKNLCPVCKYDFGDFRWENSHEICTQCFIQFGYDDCAGGDVEYRKRIYIEWHKAWKENGSQKRWRPSKDEIISIIHSAKNK